MVLDASAFYSNTAFLAGSNSEFFTTSAIIEEIEHIKKRYGALDALLDSKTLSIREPEHSCLKKATEVSKATGDFTRLSRADLSVLALALELKIKLVSDDYAVANVANALGIKIDHSTGKGLNDCRKWFLVCAACGKAFGSGQTVCPLCGNALKRKYRKISRSNPDRQSLRSL